VRTGEHRIERFQPKGCVALKVVLDGDLREDLDQHRVLRPIRKVPATRGCITADDGRMQEAAIVAGVLAALLAAVLTGGVAVVVAVIIAIAIAIVGYGLHDLVRGVVVLIGIGAHTIDPTVRPTVRTGFPSGANMRVTRTARLLGAEGVVIGRVE
jgi:type IV secretory pathway VirB2 component (pilin)